MPLSPMDWLMWNMCTVVRNIPFQLIIAAIFKHSCMNVTEFITLKGQQEMSAIVCMSLEIVLSKMASRYITIQGRQ